jgi:hypothetical protein
VILQYKLQFELETVHVPPSFETSFENIPKYFDNFKSDVTDSQTDDYP